MIAVGIDIGSRTSRIGYIAAHGAPQLFSDRHDSRALSTASCVYIDEKVALVGEPVETLFDENPLLDVAWPMSNPGGADEVLLRDSLGREWTRVGLKALLVSKLARDACSSMHDEVDAVALCIPALASTEEREVAREAVLLSGLGEPELIDAPLAAASHYGLENLDEDARFLVFDLGAQTFETSVLGGSGGGPEIVASAGCLAGGDEVEKAVAQMFAEDFTHVHGECLDADPGSIQVLVRCARELIASLSEDRRRVARQTLLLANRIHEVCLTRTQLEWLTSEMTQRLLETIERCLVEAECSSTDIEAVLVVGGCAKMPGVIEAIRSRIGGEGCRLLLHEPEAALTFGAARLAGSGAPSEDQTTAPRVPGRQIGLRVRGSGCSGSDIQVMIDQGESFPARHTTVLYTHRSGQDRVPLEVVVRTGHADDLVSLGRFVFGPIPSPERNHPVEVSLECRRAGDLLLSVADPRSGHREEWTLVDRDVQREVRAAYLLEQVEETPVNP